MVSEVKSCKHMRLKREVMVVDKHYPQPPDTFILYSCKDCDGYTFATDQLYNFPEINRFLD